jgi:membrane protein
MANLSLARLRKLQEQVQTILEERLLLHVDESGLTAGGRFVIFCARVYHSFLRNRLPVRAAALAYTNLLALVPLLGVAVSVSAGLLKTQGEGTIQDWTTAVILRVAPMLGLREAGDDALEAVVSHITGYIANFQSGTLGVSAVLVLVFVAISLLASIETTLNDMWGVTQGRGWFARVVQYWAALTLGPMFLISAVTLTTWAQVSSLIEQVDFVNRLLTKFMAPLLILSLGCSLLYLVMPNTRVQWRAALLGGLVAGILLQLNSWFSVIYMSRVLVYRQIYGGMAVLPLFLIGLYLSWLLVLLGAQVTYAFQNRRAYIQERRADNVNQRGREFVAVRLMARIAHLFEMGKRPPTALEMAEGFGVPLRLVGQVLSTLLEAGLLVEVGGQETAYFPGRPLDHITVEDILEALRTGQGKELATCDDAIRAIVQKEFESIEEGWRRTARALTLQELVARFPVSSTDGVSVLASEHAGEPIELGIPR